MRDIPPTVASLLAQREYQPFSRVYVQPHLPKWTGIVSTPSGYNPVGHDAKVFVHEGTRYLVRARAQGGHLYFQAHNNLNAIAWESQWSDLGACYQNGQIAIGYANGYLRIFYFVSSGSTLTLKALRCSVPNWASWSEETVYSGIATNCPIVAAYDSLHVFFGNTITYDMPADIPDVSVTRLYCSTYVTGWDTPVAWGCDSRWWFGKLHANKTKPPWESGDSAYVWGDTPYLGGLSVVPHPGSRDALAGETISSDYDYLVLATGYRMNNLADTGSQNAIFCFHARSNFWWLQSIVYQGDNFKDDNLRCFYTQGRASFVNGQLFVSWVHLEESCEIPQAVDADGEAPRTYEIAYSRSMDGKNWTEPHPIAAGGWDESMTENDCGPILLVPTTSGHVLYMVGWGHVYQAPATHIVGISDYRQDISSSTLGWNITQTGRGPDMVAELATFGPLSDDWEQNAFVTIEAGALYNGEEYLTQVGCGYVDTIECDYSTEEPSFNGRVTVLPAKPLQDTRMRIYTDILPQDLVAIPPNDTDQWVIDSGDWQIVKEPSWANSAALNPRNFIMMDSGNIREHLWHQVATFLFPECMDAQVEMAVRMGTDFYDFNGMKTQDIRFPDGEEGKIYTQIRNGYAWRMGFDPSFPNNKFRVMDKHGWGTCGYSAVGVCARAKGNRHGYIFAWEGMLPEWNTDRSMPWPEGYDDATDRVTGNIPSVTLPPTGCSNLLVLYLFYEHSDGKVTRYVLNTFHDDAIVLGYPLMMRMVVQGADIRCYYRLWNNTTKKFEGEWKLAIQRSDCVALGAAKFGFYARGFLGADWANNPDYTNRVYLWNGRVASTNVTQTVDDIARHIVWRSGIEVRTEERLPAEVVKDTYIESGGKHVYIYRDITDREPVLDANFTFSTTMPYGGFVFWSSDTSHYWRIGVEDNYLRLVWNQGGALITMNQVPLPITIPYDISLPMRMALYNDWVSLWLGSWLLGSFWIYPTTDDPRWGFRVNGRVGAYGDFDDVHLAELSEVPWVAQMESNQSVLECLNNFLAQRRIRRFMDADGKLRMGYFNSRVLAATYDETMFRIGRYTQDRLITEARVNGAKGYAVYKARALLPLGRWFREVYMPDLMTHQAMYQEAYMLVRDSVELSEQCNFEGFPNLQVEPEDLVVIVNQAQGINGSYIVDDITLRFDSSFIQTLGTRKVSNV